jgi:hypothetical protein
MWSVARTSVNEKSRLKSLTDRLDSLESVLREWGREVPSRVTSELVKDAVARVSSARAAIKAKHFEAVLLYHELEDLYRFLTEQFELPEKLSQAQRDARYFEGRWRAKHAPRRTLIDRRERCLNEIESLKSNGASNLTDAVINRQMAAKYHVTPRTIRNYRLSKRGN